MKMIPLILILILLPPMTHTSAKISPYLPEHFTVHEDLTPPIYIPGSPVRYNIPIYKISTGEIVTTASSIYALRMYNQINGFSDYLAASPENSNNAEE